MNEFDTKLAMPEQTPRQRGRRRHVRTRLVYRLVHVERAGDEGLARCRNISDSGLKLDLTMPVKVGDRIKVRFSSAHVFDGSVVWTRNRECGVALDRSIECQTVLRESAAETRAQGFPGLRLQRDLIATLNCDGRTLPTRVKELTQHGMQVTHDGEIYLGALLSVTLGAKKRPGLVRWSKDGLAEIGLFEPFSVSELGSLNALAPQLPQRPTVRRKRTLLEMAFARDPTAEPAA